MNGAESLVHTLADSGVELCFGNPGTSEMHFVAALDREPKMRGVLCLFEGVVAGAADGYARMTRKPATTLLHLGPARHVMSFLHNAEGGSDQNIGDHATTHARSEQPPTDIMWVSAGRFRTGCTVPPRRMTVSDGARRCRPAQRCGGDFGASGTA